MSDVFAIIVIIIVMAIIITTYLNFHHGKNKKRRKSKRKYKKKRSYSKEIDYITKQLKRRRKERRKTYILKDKNNDRKDDLVYMDITTPNEFIGKIVIRLFSDVVPRTCENFKVLCSNKNRKESYVKSPFHRVIRGFMIQGGDITNGDGTGGFSIYGGKFPDENFKLKHDREGLLSMANSGPDTNGSQFFITLDEQPHLDGKHVVFGEVVHGLEIIKRIEKIRTDHKDRPTTDIIVKKCGIYKS